MRLRYCPASFIRDVVFCRGGMFVVSDGGIGGVVYIFLSTFGEWWSMAMSRGVALGCGRVGGMEAPLGMSPRRWDTLCFPLALMHVHKPPGRILLE